MNKRVTKKLKEYANTVAKDKEQNVHGLSVRTIHKRLKVFYTKGLVKI